MLCIWLLGPALRPETSAKDFATTDPAHSRFVLDMVHNNPGQPAFVSAYNDPQRLSNWGYNGQVLNCFVEGVATMDAVAPGLISADSNERRWADQRVVTIRAQLKAAHDAGIKCYGWMQAVVFPRAIIQKYGDAICDSQGNVDIAMPKTRAFFKAQLREIFERLPELDGIVVRTGEIYLQDLHYHAASKNGKNLSQGSSAILHGPQSHIDLLTVLRDEVCVHQNKVVIYRTWDFGNHFHINPDYYLQVTNSIEPSPNLIFSIKHQAGDFHQLTPFNPTLGIGKHQQIVEVQCQREAYGKAAYPYYIGQGVIDGWEEYAWIQKLDQPKGLRDIMSNPNIAGVWTWSRGGGWDGPFISNEFWVDLNAYVLAKYAENPSRSEPDIFGEYAKKIGLSGEDALRFRELCLLSEKAVLRGQLTTLHARIDLWWARDDTLAAPNLNDFIGKGLIGPALKEKRQAVEMWERIESLSKQIHFADAQTQEFVEVSCTYGRIKYAIIEQGWTVLLYGHLGDGHGDYDRYDMSRAMMKYDQLWAEWKQLKQDYACCSTLSTDKARGSALGMGKAIDHYREVFAHPQTRPATTASTQQMN